eukprot:2561203-Prymnesium_polylepis.1
MAEPEPSFQALTKSVAWAFKVTRSLGWGGIHSPAPHAASEVRAAAAVAAPNHRVACARSSGVGGRYGRNMPSSRVAYNLTFIQCEDLMHGDGSSLDATTINQLAVIDRIVSQLSLAGDAVIILTFASSASARRSFTIRLVTFFALAD